jgi:hypothetical protein
MWSKEKYMPFILRQLKIVNPTTQVAQDVKPVQLTNTPLFFHGHHDLLH